MTSSARLDSLVEQPIGLKFLQFILQTIPVVFNGRAAC
jgi:hypothetical protein